MRFEITMPKWLIILTTSSQIVIVGWVYLELWPPSLSFVVQILFLLLLTKIFTYFHELVHYWIGKYFGLEPILHCHWLKFSFVSWSKAAPISAFRYMALGPAIVVALVALVYFSFVVSRLYPPHRVILTACVLVQIIGTSIDLYHVIRVAGLDATWGVFDQGTKIVLEKLKTSSRGNGK